MKKIAIINGVNLGELGTREVDVYGHTDFNSYLNTLKQRYPDVELLYFQSNKADELADFMLQHKHCDGIILNSGAFTHTSVILADTIAAIPAKVVEVHISNLFGRENFRKNSLIAAKCSGSLCGFGLAGYELALFYLIR
ncbi:MAG: type II 3-dehydroquinate dehydratase [Bacteroidetes bacterium]|nr:type II 3-dehydroquinate dehydratase [Bacteroidota bacterium]MCL2303185.1 type II 3-dehydroquinate dehydratase [Lentimicrobiaceae bacterium]